MKKTMLKTLKKLAVSTLAFVLAASNMTFTHAEEGKTNLLLTYETGEHTKDASQNIDINFGGTSEYNTLDQLIQDGYTSMSVSYKVSGKVSQAYPGVQTFVSTSPDQGSSWTWALKQWTNLGGGGYGIGDSISITGIASLDLTKVAGNTDKLGNFGIQIAGMTGTVTYQITNAKLIYSSTPVGESGGTVGGEESSGASGTTLAYAVTGSTKNLSFEETPVGKHGKLSVKEVNGYGTPIIVDKNGNPFQLRGSSTHGIQWDVGYNYLNKGMFQSLRDEFGVNMIRLACYITQDGYTTSEAQKEAMDERIQNAVSYCEDLGMYVLIDWHVHELGTYANPNDNLEDAKTFFDTYSKKYKDTPNVLFEICNEPIRVEWYEDGKNDLYSYANTITGLIRANKAENLVICGTNTWSQRVDQVATKPLEYDNVLYTLHFYAASHKDEIRNILKTAISNGTPVFVTEFGICSADGNGTFDIESANKWINLLNQNNISYCCWQMSNKGEASSYFKTSCSKTSGGFVASDLATTGIWLVNTYRGREEAENESEPDSQPSSAPSSAPSAAPSSAASAAPSSAASVAPSSVASEVPSTVPSSVASVAPSSEASNVPGSQASVNPSEVPSAVPSSVASVAPSSAASVAPSSEVSTAPSAEASNVPGSRASAKPSEVPSATPSSVASEVPSTVPSSAASEVPSTVPSSAASVAPSSEVSIAPSAEVSNVPIQIVGSEANCLEIYANVKGIKNVRVKNSFQLAVKKKMTMKPMILYAKSLQGGFTYQSSNTKIATVSSKGVVKAKRAGKTTITITSTDGTKNSFKLTVVKKPIKKLTISTKKTIKVKKSAKLKLTFTPGKKISKSVVFKSSNPDIATVSEKGKVKAYKKGTVKITAYATDGSGKKASVKIKIK